VPYVRAFIAGFLSTLVFHQGALTLISAQGHAGGRWLGPQGHHRRAHSEWCLGTWRCPLHSVDGAHRRL